MKAGRTRVSRTTGLAFAYGRTVTGYVVVDFETTGFSPAMQDRVVEIGCVLVDEDGVIEEHWSTLINPERDVQATLVHGITAADVQTAPTFRQIAPRLLQDSAGRTLVAHNALRPFIPRVGVVTRRVPPRTRAALPVHDGVVAVLP
jgi:hypothetical protein